MKVWTAKFDGVWMDCDAVVVAKDVETAVAILNDEIALLGLKDRVTAANLIPLNTKKEGVLILDDGDY